MNRTLTFTLILVTVFVLFAYFIYMRPGPSGAPVPDAAAEASLDGLAPPLPPPAPPSDF